ncbi:aminotransferase class IV family protein [Kribbella italica]|uniref:Branched-subunit amino acid aminotransferase/4-amino-4-deoxychorismate lyase n=1 Tax=Kribbella italica TaxID=1540520 RepID=A0A7W9J514_9ACTN|nr:aminotransferase class IV family protein [Kribbella italica]MBB5835240.1 branched-subunit amino acid aminotransferase/4-amino-4-deoxychorismate lyase [Kribbella italica]
MTSYVVHRNGRPADDLAPLAFAGYAHFTALQVRGRQARGLDLHLDRLRTASLELYGNALPDELVRDQLRTAVEAGPEDVSLMATVFSRAGEFTGGGASLELLVRTGPPADGPAGPLALTTFEHERFLPRLKHVGEPAKTYALRQAIADGYDDAAFIDRRGRLTEGTIWNLAFWDGAEVVWPRAEILTGTTMGIVRRHLEVPQRTTEITLDTLRGKRAGSPPFAGAAVMNSWSPGIPVSRIGSVEFPGAPEFLDLLHQAYKAEPLTAF